MLLVSQSFFKGAARVVDLYGSLNTYKKLYKTTDAEALRRDWQIVGQDLVNTIKTYGSRIGQKTTKKK